MKFKKFFLFIILINMVCIFASQKIFADQPVSEDDLYDCAVYQLGEIEQAQNAYYASNGHYHPRADDVEERVVWNSGSIVGSSYDLQSTIGTKDYYPLDLDKYLDFDQTALAGKLKYRCRYQVGLGYYCFAYRCDTVSDFNDPTLEMGCKPHWIVRWKLGSGLDKCTETPLAMMEICQ